MSDDELPEISTDSVLFSHVPRMPPTSRKPLVAPESLLLVAVSGISSPMVGMLLLDLSKSCSGPSSW